MGFLYLVIMQKKTSTAIANKITRNNYDKLVRIIIVFQYCAPPKIYNSLFYLWTRSNNDSAVQEATLGGVAQHKNFYAQIFWWSQSSKLQQCREWHVQNRIEFGIEYILYVILRIALNS